MHGGCTMVWMCTHLLTLRPLRTNKYAYCDEVKALVHGASKVRNPCLIPCLMELNLVVVFQ